MKLSGIILILSILVVSCGKKSNNPLSSQSNMPSVQYMTGKWIVTQSCATNGPICYQHPDNDSVRFSASPNNPGAMYYIWSLNGIHHKDLFQCTVKNDTLFGQGQYLASISDNVGAKKDTMFNQYLTIAFLPDKQINCDLKYQVYNSQYKTTMLGEVSNFYASKTSN